jgi:hypothetical protein
MSRHAVKISPAARPAARLDLLAALEESGEHRAEPWRPSACALVIPADHTLRRVMLELALIVLITPIAWAFRPRRR